MISIPGDGRPTSFGEQAGQEIERAVVAERAGAAIRSLSADDVMMPCEQAAEELTAAAVCPRSLARRDGSGGARQVTLLLEQRAEVRGGGRLAALVGTTKCDRGGRELSSFHK